MGVPQERKRVILIGWNKESSMKSYPEIAGLPAIISWLIFSRSAEIKRAGRGKQNKV